MSERVVVAMSGGVDSSVAAALLKAQGWEVIGITMCFSAVGGFLPVPALPEQVRRQAGAFGGNLPDSTTKKPTCCGIQSIEDARRIAHKLNIKHYVLNMQKYLDEYVIKDFCLEYLKGRTPNPCIRCNQYVKFEVLLKKAFSLGALFLATGHYSRIKKSKSGYQLHKARDLHKDQSYFLYRLGQPQLKHLLFPLGEYTKDQTRRKAREFDLAVADKLESQEICFLPDTDYRKFLIDLPLKIKRWVNKEIKPGPILDREGRILGEHKGIAFYTIGQRQGLGIAAGYPLYIIKIDPKNNAITVGKKEEALGSDFLVKQTHFISRPIKKKVALKVKIRYNHQEAGATIMPCNDKLKVHFIKPQFAITPGQSAVFYDKDKVVGGGIIDKVRLLKKS
jgi:tRNA-specific 2-thiouridylase